ncbi:sigma factor-like helix-turn-helix DNA-binding protein [uncultured Neglectibacter sp.]|uniref:sigma factor-like helix-turn-helix DNA-binding protein n=1 Tax=uncultured Neglectibacter sp. TaxID=1924108 RepID=UPI0034E05155
MVEPNEKERESSLQNRFSAYLKLAVNRERRRYLQKKWNTENREALQSAVEKEDQLYEPDFLSHLPLADQIENEALSKAIRSLKPKDLEILELCGIQGLTYREASEQLHRNFWTVKASYLRMIHMFRKILEGE